MKKICVIGLLVLASCIRAQLEPLSPSLVNKARKLQAYCQKQTNVSQELISQSRRNIFSNDHTLQCFLQCILEIGGMMNSQNEITLEPLKLFLPESWHETLTRVQGICGTQGGADACEIAYNTVLCYAEHNKENPMII